MSLLVWTTSVEGKRRDFISFFHWSYPFLTFHFVSFRFVSSRFASFRHLFFVIVYVIVILIEH